VGNFTLALEY